MIKDNYKHCNSLLCFFILVETYIVLPSLLSFLYRLDEPHTNFPPNVQAPHNVILNPEEAVQFYKGSPFGQMEDFQFFTGWTEADPVGDEMKWPIEMVKRGKKIMHVSHIVILQRKGGREETREANGVRHPLGRSVGEYFLQRFTGSVYILHTHRNALNWQWTCPLSWLRL